MLRILAVGDMHLGRRPSRLPEGLTPRAGELGPAAAWQRIVEEVLRENVDVVALAGDLVEHEDDFFEAYRTLRSGIQRLIQADIRVFAVAGNHDSKVLPRLAREVHDLRLLGSDGRWESVTVESNGETVTLWGRSLVPGRERDNPLEGVSFERGPGVNLGLLHCDRDQPRSSYGPVSTVELQSAGLDGWLLGHIHRPDSLEPPRPFGYLGSITALDAGEPGPRGPWLLEISRGCCERVEHWVLGPVRWELLTLDCSNLGDPEEVEHRLLAACRKLNETLDASRRPPEVVGLRLRLEGRTGGTAEILAHLERPEYREELPVDLRRHFFVDRTETAIRPQIELEQLAARADPPGLLAGKLLLLERPETDPERRAFLEQVRKRLEPRASERTWLELGHRGIDEDDLARWVREMGLRLLDRMLIQREAQDATHEA